MACPRRDLGFPEASPRPEQPPSQSRPFLRKDQAEPAIRSVLGSISVPFDLQFEGGLNELENRGGRHLTGCTSAFTVRHPATDTRGYLTAGHCGNTQDYIWWSDGSWRPATFVEQRWNSSLDVQWHRVDPVTQAVAPLFHVSKTVARPQGSVSSVLPGAQICKWGSRSLSYTCGNVTSINFAPSQCGPSGGPCSNAFVRVSIGSGNTCKGDSGGPWFVGNTAVGVHNGASPYLTAEDLCASGSNKHAHFTPIPTALGTLGLALFTG